jgi:peptidoglycan-associated lipoprotein
LKIAAIIFAALMAAGCAGKNLAIKSGAAPLKTSERTVVGVVYFETARARLRPSQGAAIDKSVVWLTDETGRVLVLEGHTDERGSDAYNMELGDVRARAVKRALVDRGVEDDSLIIISYGESMPTDVRSGPQAWRKNRRVEMVIR